MTNASPNSSQTIEATITPDYDASAPLGNQWKLQYSDTTGSTDPDLCQAQERDQSTTAIGPSDELQITIMDDDEHAYDAWGSWGYLDAGPQGPQNHRWAWIDASGNRTKSKSDKVGIRTVVRGANAGVEPGDTKGKQFDIDFSVFFGDDATTWQEGQKPSGTSVDPVFKITVKQPGK